jgi:cyclic pyranopterin phosphate synthase
VTPTEPQDSSSEPALSHVTGGAEPRATMVDVGAKAATRRRALARARVVFPPGVLAEVLRGAGPKGPIEEVARVAGILGAKRTAELIPMCHPLGLDFVDVRFERAEEDVLEVRCEARCSGATGVEMEALTGASVAALTVIDMTKALSKRIRIDGVTLLEKDGGKSGAWRA